MQTDKLYPTQSTTTDGIQLTDHLQDISGFADTMADAYLMGYIQADKMPAAFMPNYLTGGVGAMSSIYHPKNTGWGYGWLDLDAEARYATSFTRVNGEIIAHPTTWNKYRLFNTIEMARANTGMTISILFTFAFIDDAVYDGDGGTVDFVHGGLDAGGWGRSTETITYTFDQFANIIENDLPLCSSTRTGNTGVINGKSFTFEPRPSEFGDSTDYTVDHKWVKDSGQGAHAVVFIDGYEINSAMSYANGNSGGTTYYLRPFTYPDIDAVGDFQATKAMLFPASLSNWSQRLSWTYHKDTGLFELVPGNTQTYTIADYSINPGGFNFGTITDNDADFTNTALYQRDLLAKKSIWMNANSFGSVTGGAIQNIYTPLDIYRHALLYHKHTTDGTLTTYSTDTWVTKFNTKNVPSDTIVSGELSDIKLDLQPWQYPEIDITVNTFTSKDIPDSSDTGTNLIRFGAITPSEFLFGDISIEKIYFGSSLLYQKFVPEQYVKLNPTDKFISEKTSVDDYRIYGELPEGDIILSVRTPRTKNLLPYPYSGIEAGPGGDSWDPKTYYNYPDHSTLVITDHGDGTFEWVNQTTTSYKSTIVFENRRVLYPAGTYTMSHAPGATYIPQLGARPFDEDGNELGVYWDQNPGRYGTGYVTFTCNVPFYLRTDLYAANSYSYSGAYSRPQLEAGSTITEYEPPNEPTLTTITLPRALEENEYISYADQKIMPTGTPLVVPKLKTKVGENVIMIENYPRATNTITLTPATKVINS